MKPHCRTVRAGNRDQAIDTRTGRPGTALFLLAALALTAMAAEVEVVGTAGKTVVSVVRRVELDYHLVTANRDDAAHDPERDPGCGACGGLGLECLRDELQRARRVRWSHGLPPSFARGQGVSLAPAVPENPRRLRYGAPPKPPCHGGFIA